jgi:hypothetical protein
VQENQDCGTVLLAITLKLITQIQNEIEEEFSEIPHHKTSELHDGEASEI